MRISEKIDFKKYFLLSAILLLSSLFMAENWHEAIVMIIVFVAACLNQGMLVKGVIKLTMSVAKGERPAKFPLTILFLGKTILLVAALSFGVQTMGKRIIIPVLIYVIQIAVLYLSFKKETNSSEEDNKSRTDNKNDQDEEFDS